MSFLALAVSVSHPAAARAEAEVWQPLPGSSYEWQLSSARIDRSVAADIYAVDGFDVSAATVDALHADGKRVVCYISAGTHEAWRPDAFRFPPAILGRRLPAWPGERWLDVRRLDALGPIMLQRMRMCRAKGFDAVEPDNVDAWTQRTGFPLTADHQLRYNRWLARTAHGLGLAVALKNDVEQVPALVEHFDFAVAEQCAEYDECERFRPFTAAGKPVFDIEYHVPLVQFCSETARAGVYAVRKRLLLDSWRAPCPQRDTTERVPQRRECPVLRWLEQIRRDVDWIATHIGISRGELARAYVAAI